MRRREFIAVLPGAPAWPMAAFFWCARTPPGAIINSAFSAVLSLCASEDATAQLHCFSWRRGGLAVCGERAAAGDAGHRVSKQWLS
jgi:hypothetical protein